MEKNYINHHKIIAISHGAGLAAFSSHAEIPVASYQYPDIS